MSNLPAVWVARREGIRKDSTLVGAPLPENETAPAELAVHLAWHYFEFVDARAAREYWCKSHASVMFLNANGNKP